jgi:hypothetical protein
MTATRNPRPGSRVWKLANLEPGERLFLEAPAGRLAAFRQQVQVDAARTGLGTGSFSQTLVLGVLPNTREVIDLVMVTRHSLHPE